MKKNTVPADNNSNVKPDKAPAVNIIGAGLAGLSAALTLARMGIPCRLISPMPSERAQSVMAEGGINASLDTMGENDSPTEHYNDTMKGGVYLADPNAVWNLCSKAPETVRMLLSLGAALRTENGRPVLRNFGGQKKKRTAYAKSSTGKILMTALIDAVRRYEAEGLVQRYSHHRLYSLNIKNGECFGAGIADIHNRTVTDIKGSVILAGGGMNSLFPGLTTGSTVNTGDVTALAFVSGAELADAEFIQYHPTTFPISGKRCLISEAARGEGGRLFVLRKNEPWYFMEEKYPELGNLSPRDVVSREIELVRKDKNCGNQVFLDMTGLDSSVWENKLSDLREECIRYLGKDPAAVPVEVSPGIHYFMGGINVDEAHRTSISRLYAAGECACQYHGANRLGGNSMLGAVFGGQTAAQTAAAEVNADNTGEELISGIATDIMQPVCVPEKAARLLRESLGIFRRGDILEDAVHEMQELIDREKNTLQRNRMLLGQAVLLSALNRKESRGAHTRTDHPERDDKNYRKTTVAVFDGKKIKIGFRDIPEKRGEVK